MRYSAETIIWRWYYNMPLSINRKQKSTNTVMINAVWKLTDIIHGAYRYTVEQHAAHHSCASHLQTYKSNLTLKSLWQVTSMRHCHTVAQLICRFVIYEQLRGSFTFIMAYESDATSLSWGGGQTSDGIANALIIFHHAQH